MALSRPNGCQAAAAKTTTRSDAPNGRNFLQDTECRVYGVYGHNWELPYSAIEIVDLPIKMVIFHSYVSLPEGMI